MSSLRATVILPTTGDRGALLELSVPTVLNQSVRELELFIAGDGVSDAARATIRHLMAADPRIRFFDHPKDTRRGELRRHAMLQEARGRIVGYLCDRDLMLPHHVETLERLLTTADFAHTLRFGITPEGGTQFLHTLDVSDPQDRARLNEVDLLIPLSFAGHTLDMYRRLPHGWRATPPGVPTDRYMWEQFLEHPNCRAAVSFEPTVLYFKRGDHPGWPVARRADRQRPRAAAPWAPHPQRAPPRGAADPGAPLPPRGPCPPQSRTPRALARAPGPRAAHGKRRFGRPPAPGRELGRRAVRSRPARGGLRRG